MRLKSLKLAGFKSFANPTTFTFRNGITAIVGPNGCGKSNVIDAIRWVLGESSAKQLRGGSMSDVIFSGTQSKASKSLASVELTFEHTQDEQTGIRHELNLYHELSVRRQVNAEGKSDYFINGTRCRRRDVVDVFLGTGLGPRSYSVIQQGMIGRIVDSSPLQLREFIEEAAGVSRYQARREETQKKLLKTRENLERLRDIEAELTRQKKKLAKQAETASNYLQLKENLSQIREQLAIYQLYQAKAEQMHHKSSQETLTKTVADLQQHHLKSKNKFTELNARIAEEQWLKDEARDKLHTQEMLTQQLKHQLNTLQVSISQLEERDRANLDRQNTVIEAIADAEEEQAVLSEALNVLHPKIAEYEQKQLRLQEAFLPLQEAWEDSRTLLQNLELEQRRIESQLALDEQSLKRTEQDLKKWQHQNSEWQQQAAKWGLEGLGGIESTQLEGSQSDAILPTSTSLSAAIADLDSELSTIVNQLETVTDSLEVEQPLLNQLNQTVITQQTQLTNLDKQHARLIAEYETLHGIIHPKKEAKPNLKSMAQNSTTTPSIRANTSNDPTRSEAHSLLSTLNDLPTLHQQIRLSKKGEYYAAILDKWLGFWWDTRVIELDNSLFKDRPLKYSPLKDSSLENTPLKDEQPIHVDSDSDSDLKVANWHALLNVVLNPNVDTQFNQKTQDKAGSKSPRPDQANSVFFANHSQASLATSLPSLNDQLIPLSKLIDTPKLGLWQQGYLYLESTKDLEESSDQDNSDSISVATELFRQLPYGSFIITPTGWFINDIGALHISKLNSGAQNDQFLSIRLQQQERLAVLEDKLNDVESDIETLRKSSKAAQLKKEQSTVIVEERNAQHATLMHKLQAMKQQRVELVAKKERQQSEQHRLNQQREQLNKEYENLTQETTQLSSKKAKLVELMRALEPKLVDAQNLQQQLEQDRLKGTQEEREGNETLRQLQLELNKVELATKHNKQQMQQWNTQLEQLNKAKESLLQQTEKTRSDLPKIENSAKAATELQNELKAALDARNATLNDLKEDATTVQLAKDKAEREFNQLQEALAQTVTQVAIAEERINESSERLKALNPLASPASVLSDYIANERTISSEKLQSMKDEEAIVTAKIDKIGPVNLAAVAELTAVDERLLPLEQQLNDIIASMDTLTDAVASIDLKTRRLFLETLDSVNASLTHLFTKVFGGGQASLSLIKEEGTSKDNHWRAGLELMAQPKGKKNSRLAVLSGGEKTLTALSLIFAIFKQHPAPFCVLDEVDAPLDDANVARFTNLITELADDVQFIFISHNKLAMQIADELKGVTMPQAGISTLVSVSLEEAERYLEPFA